jgi:hypothetical protein
MVEGEGGCVWREARRAWRAEGVAMRGEERGREKKVEGEVSEEKVWGEEGRRGGEKVGGRRGEERRWRETGRGGGEERRRRGFGRGQAGGPGGREAAVLERTDEIMRGRGGEVKR